MRVNCIFKKRLLYNSVEVPELKIIDTHICYCKFKISGKTVCKYPCPTSLHWWLVKIDKYMNLIVRKTTRSKYQTTWQTLRCDVSNATTGPFIRGKIRRVFNKTWTVPFIRACLIQDENSWYKWFASYFCSWLVFMWMLPVATAI